MIISTNAEESIKQNPISIPDQNCQQTRNKREFPNPDKGHLQKTSNNIIFKREWLSVFSLRL